jgi:hypothetical protein
MTRFIWLNTLVIAAAALLGVGPSQAETLSISATALVLRCPCTGGGEDIAEENRGVFVAQKPDGRYFVPVVFPVTTGQKVCSFSMIYQDTNAADTVRSRLYGKSYAVGGNAVGGRHVIATVNSAAGVVTTVRVATTTAIASPTVNPNWLYYIEADVPTVNLNLLGVKIGNMPNC